MSAASVTPFPRRTPPTLLVVDHDVLSRCRISDELRNHGFRVLEANSSRDAITILDTAHIDLLFADIDLPGSQNGLDVVRHARTCCIPVQILLTSAKLEAAAIPDLNDLGLFLQKPYSVERLIDLVSRSLNWPEAPEG